jgi:hypothetical protein
MTTISRPRAIALLNRAISKLTDEMFPKIEPSVTKAVADHSQFLQMDTSRAAAENLVFVLSQPPFIEFLVEFFMSYISRNPWFIPDEWAVGGEIPTQFLFNVLTTLQGIMEPLACVVNVVQVNEHPDRMKEMRYPRSVAIDRLFITEVCLNTNNEFYKENPTTHRLIEESIAESKGNMERVVQDDRRAHPEDYLPTKDSMDTIDE